MPSKHSRTHLHDLPREFAINSNDIEIGVLCSKAVEDARDRGKLSFVFFESLSDVAPTTPERLSSIAASDLPTDAIDACVHTIPTTSAIQVLCIGTTGVMWTVR